MDGKDNVGRFVLSYGSNVAQRAKIEFPEVKDGIFPAEIDLQTAELKIRGCSLCALDDDIAADKDVIHLLGEHTHTLQCTVEANNTYRRSR